MKKETNILSQKLLDSIEQNSGVLDNAVKELTTRYDAELMEYVTYVRGVLREDIPPTDEELDDFTMMLSTLIYFTSVGCEQMGIRDDLSTAKYKEAYNVARSVLDKGTVADKNAQAELDSQAERIVSLVYNKAYKILKAEVEAAQELLSACKKVLSRRMCELETTRLSTNK